MHDSDVVTAGREPYVSRAAYKLLGALSELELTPSGRALDAGAGAGGFTQVLLEHGCTQVFAMDVGTDQLDDRVRDDPRVVVHERFNLRELSLREVGGRPVDLVVADVSFISLSMLVGPFSSVLSSDGTMLLMIKPQFEVGRDRLGRGGVVREPARQSDAIRARAGRCTCVRLVRYPSSSPAGCPARRETGSSSCCCSRRSPRPRWISAPPVPG